MPRRQPNNQEMQHHVEHRGHVEHHTHGRGAEGRGQKSPAEINKNRALDEHDKAKAAEKAANYSAAGIKEHGLKVTSRTNGKTVDVGFGPQGGGLVPANPFASLAQEGYLHAHPEKLGPEKLAEFDAATKGKKLPKRVKKY